MFNFMQQSCGACLCRQHAQVAQSCHDVASSTAQRPWLAVHAPNNAPLQCAWTHTFRCLHAQMSQQSAAIQTAAHCHQDSLQTVSHQHKPCRRCIRSHTNLHEAQKSFQALTRVHHIVYHTNTVHCVSPEHSTWCVPRVQYIVYHPSTAHCVSPECMEVRVWKGGELTCQVTQQEAIPEWVIHQCCPLIWRQHCQASLSEP